MMNCKRARLAIALAVGNDLDDAADGELQQHLAGCPTCRMHRRELEGSLGALQVRPDDEPGSLQDSVWPALSARLPSTREQRFNGWVPAAALAAACLMMFSIINEPRSPAPVDSESYAAPAFRVTNQSQFSPMNWQDLQSRRQRTASPFARPDASDSGGAGMGFWIDRETGELFGPVVSP